MGLPAQERFTLQDVADRLGTNVSHVEEMVCTLQFQYIIVKGEVVGRSPITRHLYFDRDLFSRQQYPQPPYAAWRTVLTKKEVKKQKARQIAQIQSLLAKRPKHAMYKEEAQKEIARIQNDEDVMPLHREMGPNEVANLWQPFSPSTRWERPSENVVIYIPGIALEAFKKEHGLPEHLAARFLRVTKKHLQNHIADEKYGAIRRNGRWEIQGKTIFHLLEKKDSAW